MKPVPCQGRKPVLYKHRKLDSCTWGVVLIQRGEQEGSREAPADCSGIVLECREWRGSECCGICQPDFCPQVGVTSEVGEGRLDKCTGWGQGCCPSRSRSPPGGASPRRPWEDRSLLPLTLAGDGGGAVGCQPVCAALPFRANRPKGTAGNCVLNPPFHSFSDTFTTVPSLPGGSSFLVHETWEE
eukprot:gene17670-biopygen20393